MPMSRMPTAYARDAVEYDRRTSAFARYREMVVGALPLRPGDTVIDAGCGTGLCFAAIQERIGPGGTIVGVDAAPEMLELAAGDRGAADGRPRAVLRRARHHAVRPRPRQRPRAPARGRGRRGGRRQV